jgi:hypothetical protein
LAEIAGLRYSRGYTQLKCRADRLSRQEAISADITPSAAGKKRGFCRLRVSEVASGARPTS